MRPVVKRVANSVRNRRGPGVKLLTIGRIAGTQALSNTVSTHSAPFVVIAFQPDVIQVVKTVVVRDLLRRQMAVVIEDWLIFGVIMIQTAGKFGIQQKIFSHKRGHYRLPLSECVRLLMF